MSKLLALAAAGITGLVLGGGIGVAAGDGPGTTTPPPMSGLESMDEMHAAMRGLMPEDLVLQCDAMHASMHG